MNDHLPTTLGRTDLADRTPLGRGGRVIGESIERDAEPQPDDAVTRWERVSFGAAHLALSALLALTSLPTLEVLARVFGTVEWVINYRRRRRFGRALGDILEHDVPVSERRRLTREHFMQTRSDKLFYLIFDRIPRVQAADLFTINNQELVDEAIRRGRGVYVALSHHGAHHVAALLMALRGYKVAGVRDRKEGGLRRYVQWRLDKLYPEFRRMRVIFADAYPRDIYRCFRDGYVLGSAMDVNRVRHPNQKTEEVTVFGRKRAFVSGPLRVAVRCRAAVLQAFIVPHRGFRYELDITGPLFDVDGVADEDESVGSALETYAATIETYIRTHPSLITRT